MCLYRLREKLTRYVRSKMFPEHFHPTFSSFDFACWAEYLVAAVVAVVHYLFLLHDVVRANLFLHGFWSQSQLVKTGCFLLRMIIKTIFTKRRSL